MKINLPRIYETLLRLYPDDYRAQFAFEMMTTFQEAVDDLPDNSIRRIGFVSCELIGVLKGCGVEWSGKCAYVVYRSANLIGQISFAADLIAIITYASFHSNGSFMSRCVPDLRRMRPVEVSRESWYGWRNLRLQEPS